MGNLYTSENRFWTLGYISLKMKNLELQLSKLKAIQKYN